MIVFVCVCVFVRVFFAKLGINSVNRVCEWVSSCSVLSECLFMFVCLFLTGCEFTSMYIFSIY